MVLGLVAALFSLFAPSATALDHPGHGAGACVVDDTVQTKAGKPGRPGNNGTIKIDGCPLDNGSGNDKKGNGQPDNEPHVGCRFAVDWYNYDKSPDAQHLLYSTIEFRVWPPTGPKTVLTYTTEVAHTPSDGVAALNGGDVYIGEDDSSGANEAGLDASIIYDLTDALAAFTPHPQHGWHVKVTVRADGSQGSDVKHKVFWVAPCEQPTTTTTEGPTTTTTEGPTTTTTEAPTTTTTQGGGGGGGTVRTTTTVAPTSTTVGVLPTQLENTTTTAAAAPATVAPTKVKGVTLARTGSETRTMLQLAGLALFLGGMLLLGSDYLPGGARQKR